MTPLDAPVLTVISWRDPVRVDAAHGGRQRHRRPTDGSRLVARGERVLLVETSGLPQYERTRAFYRANGYHEEARIREFYAAGEDKVVFRKALTPPVR